MKTAFLLFTILILFFSLKSNAAAPYGIKGQNQSSVIYPNVHQFPNNQVTNLGGINALVETGNKNILVNPSFEHSTFSTGWTNSAGTFTQETSVLIDGKASAKLVLSAQTMSLTQSSSLYATQYADGIQGLAMVRIKSDVALKVCSIQAGIVSTTNCQTTPSDSKWSLIKIPFIFGATSNGISIASSGSVSGTVYVDDCFVGAVDLKQDINNIGPWTTFTPTGTWTANTTYTGKYRQVGENLEVQYYWATSGAPTSGTNTLNLPSGFTIDTSKIPNPSPTAYTVIGSDCSVVDLGVMAYTCQALYSTTTSFYMTPINAASTNSTNTGAITNAIPFTWGSTDSGYVSIKVPVTQFAGSTSVYTSNNADTNWASCGLTGSAFTGFGSSVPTPSLQCKREGSDLLMKGTFTAGTTPTAVEARMALPLWQGVQLVSANSSVIPSLQITGKGNINTNSATFFSGISTLIEPSVSYMTFGLEASSGNGITKANGSAVWGSGNLTSIIVRIPIEGWNNSNIIIGSFSEVPTTRGSNGADIQSVHFGTGAGCTTACSTGTCAICNQVGSKITSVTWVASSVYNLNGIDGTKYNCIGGGNSAGWASMIHRRDLSTSSYAQVNFGYNITSTNVLNGAVTCIGIP